MPSDRATSRDDTIYRAIIILDDDACNGILSEKLRRKIQINKTKNLFSFQNVFLNTLNIEYYRKKKASLILYYKKVMKRVRFFFKKWNLRYEEEMLFRRSIRARLNFIERCFSP